MTIVEMRLSFREEPDTIIKTDSAASVDARRAHPMATVGIHLIWTTYGTWLPGDSRSHWSPLFDHYRQIRERGGKLNPADLTTRDIARERMRESPKFLTEAEIEIVADSLSRLVCHPGVPVQEPRLPCVYAAAIEANHVHLLLGPLEELIAVVAGRLKGRTSSDVLALESNRGRERTWTAKYWKVFLFDALALDAVKKYIEEHNLRRGLPAAPYPWICPVEV